MAVFGMAVRICQRHGHGEDAKTVPPDSHFEAGDGPAPSGLLTSGPDSDLAVVFNFDGHHIGTAADRAIFHVFLRRPLRGINGNNNLFAARLADVTGIVLQFCAMAFATFAFHDEESCVMPTEPRVMGTVPTS